MPLLTEDDYAELAARNILNFESEPHRLLVFQGFILPEGMYKTVHCDVLVKIPTNYPQQGNDMFWTSPCLELTSGAPIPKTHKPGAGVNVTFSGVEYCRWSRHWPSDGSRSAWRADRDNVITIYRRIDHALRNP